LKTKSLSKILLHILHNSLALVGVVIAN